MPDFLTILGQKAQDVRALYSRYKIPLKEGEGLARALAEAESLSQAGKPPAAPSEGNTTQSVQAALVVYSLADHLEACVNAGLDVSNWLKQITTGSIDYGTRDLSDGQSIYFKDFECELFVASCLIRRGLTVQLLDQPNDPRGDLRLGDFFIEVKHPNSVGQLRKLLRKFNNKMRENGTYGASVVGIEDAFELGDREDFESVEDYDAWLKTKREGMEAVGLEIIRYGANLPRIGAMAQTQTKLEIVGGQATLIRKSNSCIFDHRPEYPQYRHAADSVAGVFNPTPRRYSALFRPGGNDQRTAR